MSHQSKYTNKLSCFVLLQKWRMRTTWVSLIQKWVWICVSLYLNTGVYPLTWKHISRFEIGENKLETISKHNLCPTAGNAYCKIKASYINMRRRNLWMTHLCCCRFCHLEMCISSWSPRGWCHTGTHIYLHANQPHSNSFHSNTFHGLKPKQILYSEKEASF